MEIPTFISINNEFKSKGLHIIGLSVDDTPDIVQSFLKKNPEINYPISMLSDTFKNKLPQIQYLPTTFILDKSLNIVHTLEGYREKDELLGYLNALL